MPGLVRNSKTKRCAASRPPSLAGSEINPRRIGATSAAAAIFPGSDTPGKILRVALASRFSASVTRSIMRT